MTGSSNRSFPCDEAQAVLERRSRSTPSDTRVPSRAVEQLRPASSLAAPSPTLSVYSLEIGPSTPHRWNIAAVLLQSQKPLYRASRTRIKEIRFAWHDVLESLPFVKVCQVYRRFGHVGPDSPEERVGDSSQF